MRLILLFAILSFSVYAVKPAAFTKVVPSSASPQCLVASNSTLASTDVAIQTLSTNTGYVWVGDSSVTSSGPGIQLAANQAISFSNVAKRGSAQPFTLKDICLAVTVNGEGVSVLYTKDPEVTL